MSACKSAARRRFQARRNLRERWGTDKVVAARCVDLCIEGVEGLGMHLNCRGIAELVWLLQRVLHTTKRGASLPVEGFSSIGLGCKLLEGLVQCRLIWCPDPNSWKPHGYDTRNSEARRFRPTTELLLANAGLAVVDSGPAYLLGKYLQRTMPVNSTVTLMPDLASLIPPHLCGQLEKGTGLSFNLSTAMPILAEFSEEKRACNLQAAQTALGCLGNPYSLNTTWFQAPSGRLYARQPPIINIPKLLRPALVPLHGGFTCEVDYQNFEARILYAQAEITAPPGDYAQFVGDKVGLPRKNVKAVLNPLLHGQTRGNLIGLEEWAKLEDRKKVETYLQREYPTVWQTIQAVQHDPFLLQRRGAEVFFAAYGKLFTTESLAAGLPLHDGLVFAAKDQAQLLHVKGVFEEVGTQMLGQPTPAKHMILNQ